MRAAVLVVPGRLETPTGGYVYDRRMSDNLPAYGWPVEVLELDGGFPFPSAAAVCRAAGAFAALPDRTLVLVDGLALGAIPDVIEREASRLRIVALVHLPLSADPGLDSIDGIAGVPSCVSDIAERVAADERRALRAASLVIVTGTATLDLLARYDLPRDRVVVVEPGTAPAPLARGSGGGPLRLLTVATLNPGKGHELLLEALASLPTRDWHLTCAGSTTRHPATTARVRSAIERLELSDRVSLVGELDAVRLGESYDAADLFVLATYRETYGMAVAEALARGLPIVSTTTGAIPELVGTDAGVLAPPGDRRALTDALARVIDDSKCRARLADGAARARARLPTWEQAAGRMAAALDRLDAHG
jgi:glycosyltransferase involved in cell wall biosynthesis